MNNLYAYIAGLIDGEGCVNTYQIKNGRGVAYPTPIIVFVQAEGNKGEEICHLLKDTFGGHISSKQPKNPKYQKIWRHEVRGSFARKMATLISPYSIIKKSKLLSIAG